MNLQPIQAETLEELLAAINDRLRKIILPSALDRVGLPKHPDSPVPRHWVEANFVAKDSLRELMRTEVMRVYSTQSRSTVRSHAIVLSVSGTLAVMDSAAPLLMLDSEFPASRVRALLKRPPVGDSLIVAVTVGGNEWARVVVEPESDQGETLVSASLPASQVVSIDILQVGSAFPGAGLTVEVL